MSRRKSNRDGQGSADKASPKSLVIEKRSDAPSAEPAKFEAADAPATQPLVQGASEISPVALAAGEPVSVAESLVATSARVEPCFHDAAVQPARAENAIIDTAVAAAEPKSLAPPPAASENTEQENPVLTLQKDTFEMATQPEFTAAPEIKAKPAFAKVQDTARVAYEKSAAVASELGTFTKGNLEALTESGKILGAGVKNLGQEYVGASKVAANVVSADFKELTAVRSPAEFFKLQEKILRRNIGAAYALSTKNGEALVQLSKDAAAPLTRRLNAAVEKISTTA